MVTKIGENYFGEKEDIEMLKTSQFDLKYHYKKHGKIDRKLVRGKNMAQEFSEEYEIIKYFSKNENNKQWESVIVKNREEEYFYFTKGEPLDV